ncbi:NEQ228 [Nanoarchaeum equitans Kin4-M]|uniref:tRNA (guanine(37)-N(1))/4-demethylwyosine(37)-methyltransferase Taw22 n=1 Tax=Nanoarchaeum equitans (strain Kin4-M) TaxID=228908 RepID=TAW22_NANEQ|nr:RecName: Full=tRNA (guanine(37)-N1)/4-demethylwyosine(37)-methyltransferase Taw22; AltName: Full=tRNA(Phe):m1G/imG2 methyltransferase [Nanoarchaeum equitans Kin4-M]AAR39082.1 NEQ228 [Nanoarchaeum equitans Kin4-M]
MSYDIIGEIAIIYPPVDDLDKIVNKILKHHKYVKAIYLKTDKLETELRLPKLKLLYGEPILETTYKENKCVFKLRVDKVYFSPRLSTERKEFIDLVKDNEKILIPFAGVNPYPIVIAKHRKVQIKSIELNPWAVKYGIINTKLNKVNVDTILADFGIAWKYIRNLHNKEGIVTKYVNELLKAKPELDLVYTNEEYYDLLNQYYNTKLIEELKPGIEYFDRIIMPLPKGGEHFIFEALVLAKKYIHLYSFAHEKEIEQKVKEIIDIASQLREIKHYDYKIVGDIGVRKYRIRINIYLI